MLCSPPSARSSRPEATTASAEAATSWTIDSGEGASAGNVWTPHSRHGSASNSWSYISTCWEAPMMAAGPSAVPDSKLTVAS